MRLFLSACWRVAASLLFFSLSVLHVKCGREVSFGCCVIPVCLLVHDTRSCIKAQSLLPAEFQSDLFLSPACRAEHI